MELCNNKMKQIYKKQHLLCNLFTILILANSGPSKEDSQTARWIS